LRKFFTSNLVFTIATVLAVLFGTVGCYFAHKLWNEPLVNAFIFILLIFLYTSGMNRNKNVMKGLMGALLMACVINAFSYMSTCEIPADYICSVVYMDGALILFINHFLINSKKTSSPSNIRFNQIVVAILAVNVLVWNLSWLSEAESPLEKIALISLTISMPCTYYTVVCVESRLDAYKIEQEQAGCNQENTLSETLWDESGDREDDTKRKL